MEAKSPPQNDRTTGFEVRYQHAIVEGARYEAGRLQGEFLKQANRALISYEPPEPVETADRMRRLYDEHCPGRSRRSRGWQTAWPCPSRRLSFAPPSAPPSAPPVAPRSGRRHADAPMPLFCRL